MGETHQLIPPCFGPIAHLVGRPKANAALSAFNEHMKNKNDSYEEQESSRPLHFDKQTIRDMQTDRNNGMLAREVAEKYGCSIGFVHNKTSKRKGGV